MARMSQVVLIISSVVYGVSLIPVGLLALSTTGLVLLSFINFGFSRSLEEWVSALSVLFASLGSPLITLGSLAGAWMLYRKRAYRKAIILNLVPLVLVPPLFLYVVWFMGQP